MKAFRQFIATAIMVACVLLVPSAAPLLGQSQKAVQQPAEEVQRFFAGAPVTRNGWDITTFHYTAYSVGYLETSKTPIWSAYVTFRIDKPEPSFKTRPAWKAEPKSSAGITARDIPGQPWKNSDDADLSGVRIDKGHLTPLADIAYRFGLTPAEETFRLVNVVPQLASNNRGPWQLLESIVSGINSQNGYQPGLVDQAGIMWIITGPIFDAAPSWSKGAMTLPSGVPIPSKMFKVLISGTRSNPQFTCFIMANENLPKSMATVRSSLVTLAEVEEATGLDLTPELDQETKSRAAGVKDPNQWLVKKAKEQE